MMKLILKPISSIVVLLGCLGSVTSHAQDTREAELSSADKQLNITFKQIIAKVDQPTKTKLVKAQRAWLTFRDLDCSWAFQADRMDCLLDRTSSRTKQLEETAFYDAKGKYGILETSPSK